MKSISIRIATAGDAQLIATLSRETFYNAFAFANTKADMDKFMNEVFTEEKLIAEVSLPKNIFLLAYHNNNVVGYVRMRDEHTPEINLSSDNVMEIARIYTVSSQTNKGIGSLLMQECINMAKQKQRDYIWLGVWEHNSKAIKFYQRFKFEKFGTHPFLLGDDVQTDWLMAKKLF